MHFYNHRHKWNILGRYIPRINVPRINPYFFSMIHSVYSEARDSYCLISSKAWNLSFNLSSSFWTFLIFLISHVLTCDCGWEKWLILTAVPFFGSLFSFCRSPFSCPELCWQDWRMPNGQKSIMPFWNTLPRTPQSPFLPSSSIPIWGWS